MKELINRVPLAIVGSVGDDEIQMTFQDGAVARWYHEQDCCERVIIEDITGDWADLIGNPLLVAEERSDGNPPPQNPDAYRYESGTWTFYAFRSIKGSVDVRWLGISNGYYSERVEYKFEPPPCFEKLALNVARARLGIVCEDTSED